MTEEYKTESEKKLGFLPPANLTLYIRDPDGCIRGGGSEYYENLTTKPLETFMTLNDINHELNQERRCITCAAEEAEIIDKLRKTWFDKLRVVKSEMLEKNLVVSSIPYKEHCWNDIEFWQKFLKSF
jgi:hypothetical protein